MGRRFAAPLVAVMVTTLVGVGPRTAFAGAEDDFVSKINAERGARGLRTLSVESDLTAVARRHSQRMAKDGAIYHNPNLGSEVRGWRTVGENVGRGRTVQKIHDAFMASDYHARNIVDPAMNQLGVGVAYGDDGRIYVTQIFAERGSSGGGGGGGSPAPAVARAEPSAGPERSAAPRPTPKPEPIAVEMLLHVVRLH